MLPELTGIVACGGSSSRMGTDKCFLNYHGKPQCYFLYDLLKIFCARVFLSCLENQSSMFEKGYDTIADKTEFKGHGPISGLLSAFSENVNSSLLYIGCDYPFINQESLQLLISNRKAESNAVSFLNDQNLFEPLITIYENNCRLELQNQFYQNNFSLQDFLKNNNTIAVRPKNIKAIKSIDTKEEYRNTILNFKKSK